MSSAGEDKGRHDVKGPGIDNNVCSNDICVIQTSLLTSHIHNSEYARKHVKGICVKDTYVSSVRREVFDFHPSCCRKSLEATLSAAGVASPGVKLCQVPHRALDCVDVYSPIPLTRGGVLIEVGHGEGS